jgi:hypothetical protein
MFVGYNDGIIMHNNPQIERERFGLSDSVEELPEQQYNAPSLSHMDDIFNKLKPNYNFKSRFSKKINEKAWAYLSENFTDNQWVEFNKGMTIELINRKKTHRLLLNKSGAFAVLKGGIGDGVMVTNGAIREETYPMGDEMKSFIEWFVENTEQLISKWGCGNFAIRNN